MKTMLQLNGRLASSTKKEDAIDVEYTCLETDFWKCIKYGVNCGWSLVKVFSLVDSDLKPEPWIKQKNGYKITSILRKTTIKEC